MQISYSGKLTKQDETMVPTHFAIPEAGPVKCEADTSLLAYTDIPCGNGHIGTELP
jgi:hypothetical protein